VSQFQNFAEHALIVASDKQKKDARLREGLSATGLRLHPTNCAIYQSNLTVVGLGFGMPTPGVNYTFLSLTNDTGNGLNVSANGIPPNPTDVGVNPVGLPIGIYNGTITLNALNGGNNPQTIMVNRP
jgi:hypothetical protein